MEPKFQLTQNGQQLTTDDVNLLGTNSAMADDRVLAELLRLPQYDGTTVSRGIIPAALFGNTTSQTSFPLVAANGASGSVKVQPFRAVIGSRTAVGTDAKANWRDIRSAICVGTTTREQVVSIAANASGNPRWDLIYAAVAVDANGSTVTRKIKNPATKVIAGTSVVTTLTTNVSLAVLQGTAAASAVWPAVPSDSGSTYYIPLAYIRVPNGFTATSTVAQGTGNATYQTSIALVANVLGMSSAVTGGSIVPATVNNHKFINTTQQASWASTGNVPTGTLAPFSGAGVESILLYIDLTTASPNFASGAVIDNSRDWTNRYFRMTVCSSAAPGTGSSSMPGRGNISTLFNGAYTSSYTAASNHVGYAVGHSFVTGGVPPGTILTVGGTSATAGQAVILGDMAAAGTFSIGINSSGQMVASYSGTPNCALAIWLDASPRVE